MRRARLRPQDAGCLLLGLPVPADAGEGVGVPWCETCNRFYNPSNVAPDGTCVKCGRFIADAPDPETADTKVPWHFWILVAALVLYLGWRLVEFIIYLVTGEWPG